MSSTTATTSTTPMKRIFCYGDSLTAGTSPPLDQLFPYGPHLERVLNECMSPSLSSEGAVMVRWRGLPGWTSSAMVDYMNDSSVGLQSVLDGIRNPSLSLVIILAGTNDIGSLTSSMFDSGSSSTSNKMNDDENVDVSLAVDPILSLHKACLECEDENGKKGIHTLAVGIPGSAWQEMNPNASQLCTDMNDALQAFATLEDRVSYVDFPFPYQRGDSKWSGDGLHLSSEGYEVLGKGLAPRVKQILESS